MNSELSSPGVEPAIPASAGLGPDLNSKRSSVLFAADTFPFRIPPILLEGDDVEPAAETEDAQKFSLGTETPAEEAQPEGELPDSYGTQKVLLTARDPHWLCAHWDLTPEQQQKHAARAEDGLLRLRVYRNAVSDRPVAEVQVHPDSRHWFVHVEKAGAPYIAELGYREQANDWSAISVSASVATPPDAMSRNTQAEFATIPIGTPMSTLVSLARPALGEKVPLAEALETVRRNGHPELPSAPPVATWTSQQRDALMASIRDWAPQPQSFPATISSWPGGVSSPGETPSGLPTSRMDFSSPHPQPSDKQFWFKVNVELVLYGSTEPDAKVAISGKEVRLNPDGTFRFRFALPDGKYELPVVAVSSDQSDVRAAELKFTRATRVSGDVGAHPHAPDLRPPGGCIESR